MKKKLIFIMQALWIGGIETALVNLLGQLDCDQYDVTCLILRNETQLASRLPPSCRLIVADRENYPFAWLAHLTEEPEAPSRLHRALSWLVPALGWVENRLFIRHIRKMLRGEKFDTAVIYSDAAAEAAARAVPADKFLLFYHHGAMRKVRGDEIAYRKCEKIITISHHQEAALRRFRPRYAHKMTTIHNLTDAAEVGRRARAFAPNFDRRKCNIVTCGRLHRDKGMDLAVEACAALVAAGHEDIQWWIIGGGPEEAALRGQIVGLRLENHIFLLGMRENPCPYIAGADLYVQPSRVEGYPMSILEAQILGIPVLATDTGGARELLEEDCLREISGYAIAAGVEAFLQNPFPAHQRDWEAENRANMEKLEALLS